MAAYSSYTDQELTSRLAESDEYAFAEIYKRYKTNIYLLIKKFVHSAQMADDLTQEVFVKIWESGDKLSEVRSIKAYLLITAKNHTLNSLKKALRSEAAMGVVINAYVDERKSVEEDLISKEYAHFLQQQLSTLPARSREIFKLCREQGKTYDEAAVILGISRNAIKNHMVATMKVLSSSVEKDLGISLSLLLVVLFK
ncbi:sigma-70 family RNA polymerase sigma factor [Pedobacter sp. MC2016-14]|uniref:RNA polymerase sigma factor n=1 Tax=Pedobacter sp. MC2016-14 TaxID=2897327 RepID=UPI001E5C9063|nr:sigma-70 family RNA polymerase sigma factor [Pedobacter sp. MC2016-14]MCD0487598.1 sigma-70 family RNA polymerase sigma factor [Pedobacter sp. MC2016-14]